MTLHRTLLTAALAALLATSAAAQTMKAADVHPAGYPTVVAVENMGKKLDAATQGRIKFQMFPGSVLGGEKEMIEQTQVGAIQILRTSLGPVGPVVPEVNVFNMPFVFRDIAHMRAVIDGPDRPGAAGQAQRQPGPHGGPGLDGRWQPQPVHQEAGAHAGRPEGPEDPHDGQPAVRGHHERDGWQRHRDGLMARSSPRSRPA